MNKNHKTREEIVVEEIEKNSQIANLSEKEIEKQISECTNVFLVNLLKGISAPITEQVFKKPDDPNAPDIAKPFRDIIDNFFDSLLKK